MSAGYTLGSGPVRIRGFDGLRAIAVAFVLVVHAGFYGREYFDGGRLGVQIFFVLSGFLITALLIREFDRTGTIRLGAFYLRRAVRLLPVLAAVIAALLVVVALGLIPGDGVDPELHEMLAVVTYWDNWYRAYKVGPATWIDHCWSLSLEEQFYFAWPPLLLLGLRRGRRFVLPGALAVFLGSVVTRIVLYPYVPQHRLYFGSDTRVDGIALGCVLALLWSRGLVDRAARLFRAMAIPALVLLLVLGHYMTINTKGTYIYGFVLCDVATAVLIGAVAVGAPRPVAYALEHPFVTYVGRISYGFYLWHWPIFGLIEGHTTTWRWWELVPLEFSVAFLVAVASFHFLEQPVIRWGKRRAEQRRDDESAPAAPPVLVD